ncbi:bifunctional diaminohydroxyphosphoribosylaminopyrimidine deaminase/5-amino-6-(5-phosphoribosylamino)uracil reductase RibD [Glaciihabitans sp. dw_435]|uniref:bifunctional diaminohydroxyphosphoribosylaminopyrimidine deaminase/5-amino-6-(5-phosphoribosylamino)uracil reductase RibD n=1 Tax=Glaciihabitans sp. dw_435 TaxID=2720081 RepID=UPI002107B96A|nr:bifunctional diaminohydroxyphosphoribosylaminopyrimidine deaminase/5-amino-6-(5-phosphoribosylamino)uracil reductase RibD [Glaciihabitans sp. dw_435]
MNTPGTDIETAMRHALDLASRGPAIGVNPQVGCVLLDASGHTVAEGWHRGVGTPHAEVDALSKLATREVTAADGTVVTVPDARGLSAVVTLEPCNHTGHTGPCSEALIAAGVSAVYFAVSDPGIASSGGAARLIEAGIPVTGGVLAAEAEEFLRVWLTAVRLRRPFVTVKWASTLDGRAAAADGSSQWITGTAARQRVHEQREASDVILVGTGTVLADDPSLTARGDAGELMEHQPVPVVIGERDIPNDAKLRTHPAGLIQARTRDLGAVLSGLFDRGYRRAFVEGGPRLASALIAAGLVDEVSVYLAPTLLGGPGLAIGDLGIPTITAQKRLDLVGVEQLGNDLLITARPVAAAVNPVAGSSTLPSTFSTTPLNQKR